MRTTTTQAWAAALAVMSMRGPFTKAEAAPAQEPERPKYYFPRHVKRQYPNLTAIAETSTTFAQALSELASSSSSSSTSSDDLLNGLPIPQFNPPPPTHGITSSSSTSTVHNSTTGPTTSTTPLLTTSTSTSSSSSQESESQEGAASEQATYPTTNPGSSSSGSTPNNETTSSTSTESAPSTSTEDDGLLDGLVGSTGLLRPESVTPTASSSESEPTRPARNSTSSETTDESSSSTSEEEEGLLPTPSLSVASTGLLPPVIVQPTPESPVSQSSSSPGLFSFNPERPSGTGTGNGFFGEATPTARHSASLTASSSSEISTPGPILVGLTTYFESTTSLGETAPADPSQNRPSASAQEVLPTGTGSSTSSSDFNPLESIVGPLANITLGITPPESVQGTGIAYYPTTASPAPTATGTQDIPGLVSSMASEVSSAASSALSEASGSVNSTGGLPIVGGVSSALSEIASSLSSELSGIVATATDANISSSLASEFSGILSSAASSLAAQTEIPSVSATLTGTGVTVPTSLYTLSTSTGESGISAIPVPLTTGSPSSSRTDSLTVTASDNSTTVATSYSSSSGTAASTYPTTIPLTTGTSVTLTASSTSTASNTTETGALITSTESSTSRESSSYSSSEVSSPSVTTPPTTSSEASETSTSKPPASIVPTGSDSFTSMTYPTSLAFAPSTTDLSATTATETGMPLDSTTTSAPTGMPSAIPRLIQPPGGLPTAQPNMTLVQVGFNYGLNYQFVVNTEDSAGQIFLYLPQGIAYGLGISEEKVVMNALMPFDTTKRLSYITTLAQAWVPSNLVNQLQLDLLTQQSALHHNPDDSVAMLISMINPTIPLLPGPAMDEGLGTSSYNPGATASAGGYGAPIGGDAGSSQKVKGTSVGIGVGAVAGAAVYAAAMVYVARRYRKRRRSHQRTSSVPTAGEMSQRSPGALSGGMGGYFMSGANGLRGSGSAYGSNSGSGRSSGRIGIGRGSRNSAGSSNGRSVREQGISAPVMAENSLGWN